MTPHDLTFHLVFVPGTVPMLLPATHSLCRHSPYRYRLVANGLGRRERRRLRTFADHHDRLELSATRTGSVIPHGEMLDLLFADAGGEFFCFCDTDIFACGDFSGWIEERLPEVDALSSCTGLFWEDAPVWRGFFGRCSQTPTGTPLLSSYFAVYRAQPVREARTRRGIGFHRRRRGSTDFTDYELDLLRAEGWDHEMCDTGKVLDLHLRRRGRVLRHAECPHLLHVGGVSWWLTVHAPAGWNDRPNVLQDDDIDVLDPTAADARVNPKDRTRPARSRWFAAYLQYLLDRGPRPIVRVTDPVTRRRVEHACDVIRGAVSRWKT